MSSYASFLDRVRARNYARSSGQCNVLEGCNPQTVGPTGPGGAVICYDETGSTGPAGTGYTGPTGYFNGQLVYASIVPGAPGMYSLGTEDKPFNAAYISSGVFGPLTVSPDGNSILPTNGNVNLGSTGARFGQIFTNEITVQPHTIIVLDDSGNQMNQSYLLDRGLVNYTFFDPSIFNGSIFHWKYGHFGYSGLYQRCVCH